jgi:hypothetical protein
MEGASAGAAHASAPAHTGAASAHTGAASAQQQPAPAADAAKKVNVSNWFSAHVKRLRERFKEFHEYWSDASVSATAGRHVPPPDMLMIVRTPTGVTIHGMGGACARCLSHKHVLISRLRAAGGRHALAICAAMKSLEKNVHVCSDLQLYLPALVQALGWDAPEGTC